jgi:outer membrane protein OmpA-like peptidoglycan-associated protein
VNTRDPRDPGDSRNTEYRQSNVIRAGEEPGRDLRWLWWVIPVAIALIALPFIFRGHREPVQATTAAVEQATPSTSVYLNNASDTLTDADQQKLARVASSARQNGSSIDVAGSGDRANAVRQVLISQGVPESNIHLSEAAAAASQDATRVDVSLR